MEWGVCGLIWDINLTSVGISEKTHETLRQDSVSPG